MDAVPGMHLAQTKEEVSGLQCVHSKAAASFFPRWEDHLSIGDLEDTDICIYKVVFRPSVRALPLFELSNLNWFICPTYLCIYKVVFRPCVTTF